MSAWPSTPAEQLTRLFRGFWVSRAIYVAAELGIADHLAGGSLTAAQLAPAVGADAVSLHRLLRLLASEGVFAESESGRFELTPMAEMLRRDVGGPLRLQVLFLGRDATWQATGGLLHAVRTGGTAFDQVHGVDFFGYNRRHPADADLFDQLMAAQTAPAGRAVAKVYDFSQFQSITDVAGGRGALAIEILNAHTHLRGVVFDQPEVAEGARTAIAAAGLAARCQAVGGDMFAEVPAGTDAHLLKYVLHDWDDERCVAILRACRRALPANGRLLVVEQVLPSGNAPSFAKTQDVNMLVNFGGRERTLVEYQALFEAAGFRVSNTIPVLAELHTIEGTPV